MMTTTFIIMNSDCYYLEVIIFWDGGNHFEDCMISLAEIKDSMQPRQECLGLLFGWTDTGGRVTATHCNALKRTATHCNTLQHTHCNALKRTETHCNTLQRTATHCNALQCTATHCNTLQHPATPCNTLHQLNVAHQAD